MIATDWFNRVDGEDGCFEFSVEQGRSIKRYNSLSYAVNTCNLLPGCGGRGEDRGAESSEANAACQQPTISPLGARYSSPSASLQLRAQKAVDANATTKLLPCSIRKMDGACPHQRVCLVVAFSCLSHLSPITISLPCVEPVDKAWPYQMSNSLEKSLNENSGSSLHRQMQRHAAGTSRRLQTSIEQDTVYGKGVTRFGKL